MKQGRPGWVGIAALVTALLMGAGEGRAWDRLISGTFGSPWYAETVPEPMRLRTIEWLVAGADVIARGIVEELDGPDPLDDLTIRVTETLKGEHRPYLSFLIESADAYLRVPMPFSFQRTPLRVGDAVLIVLERNEHVWFSKTVWTDSAFSYGRYNARTVGANDYGPAESRRIATLVVPLALDEVPPIYTADFQPIHQSGQILDRMRQLQHAAAGKRPPNPVLIEVPAWARARGLPPYMQGAADEEMEQRAWMWAMSDEPALRRNAARILGEYSSFGSRHFLERLLADGQYRLEGAGRSRKRVYTVREDAAASLQHQGVTPPPVVIVEPLDRYRAIPRPALVLLAVIVFASLLVAATMALAHKAGLRIGLLLTCVWLAFMAGGILWTASHWIVIDLQASVGRASHQLSHFRGAACYIRMEGADGPELHAKWCWMTADNDLAERWDGASVLPEHRHWSGWGIVCAWRPAAGLPAGSETILLRLPHWLLLTPALLWLAWTLFQRRRRQRRGHCGRCNYNLHGSTDRCPECGTQAVGARHASPSATRGL